MHDIILPSNKKFGLFLTCLFLILGCYFIYIEKAYASYAFLGLSILILAITYINSHWLHPLNRAWMGLGLLMGKVISPIVLGIIFFLIFTPLALILGVFGRDELGLKFTKTDTYWHKREDGKFSKSSFKNQF